MNSHQKQLETVRLFHTDSINTRSGMLVENVKLSLQLSIVHVEQI